MTRVFSEGARLSKVDDPNPLQHLLVSLTVGDVLDDLMSQNSIIVRLEDDVATKDGYLYGKVDSATGSVKGGRE